MTGQPTTSTTSTTSATSTPGAAGAAATPREAPDVEAMTLAWVSEILDEPDVHPDDNFIDLGGHSILAVRLSRRAREHLGCDFDLMLLFEKDLGTAAAELAARVREAAGERR